MISNIELTLIKGASPKQTREFKSRSSNLLKEFRTMTVPCVDNEVGLVKLFRHQMVMACAFCKFDFQANCDCGAKLTTFQPFDHPSFEILKVPHFNGLLPVAGKVDIGPFHIEKSNIFISDPALAAIGDLGLIDSEHTYFIMCFTVANKIYMNIYYDSTFQGTFLVASPLAQFPFRVNDVSTSQPKLYEDSDLDTDSEVEEWVPKPNPLNYCSNSYDTVDEIYETYALQALVEEQSDVTNLATESLTPTATVPNEVTKVSAGVIGDFDHDEASISTLEVGQVAGPTSSRLTSVIDTPSGSKTVVHLSTDTLLTLEKQNYNMATTTPDWSQCWAPALITKGQSSTRITPVISRRETRMMEFFTYFNCLMCTRIVAKMPMFSSQRFRISVNSTGSGTADSDNQTGFEWNPSEEPEIYVLTPWNHVTRLLNIADYLSGKSPFFPKIAITPVTDIIYTEGLPTEIIFKAYSFPYMNTVYRPLPSEDSVTPTPPDPPSPTPTPGAVSISTTPFDFRVGAGTLVDYDNQDITSILTIKDLIFDITTGSPPGDEQISLIPPSGGVRSPLFAISSTTVNGTRTQNVISSTVKLTELGKYQLDLSKVFNPDFVTDLTVFIHTPQVEEETYSLQGKFSYDPEFKENTKDYGHIGNHTKRVDTHWSLLESLPFASIDDVAIFKMGANPQTSGLLVYSDQLKHLFSSKYPTIQVRCTSVPSANVTMRITQIPMAVEDPVTLGKETPMDLSLAQTLELPGTEFDPKDGSFYLKPYWDRLNPADRFPQVAFRVDVLGGTISTEPVYVSVFMNASPMEYHHLAEFEGEELYTLQGLTEDPQMESNRTTEAVDGDASHVSASDARFQYLKSFQVNPDIGGVAIPVNSRLLGAHAWKHAARFLQWFGTIKLKVMINNGSLTNANVHFVHSNKLPPTGEIVPEDYLVDVGFAVTGAVGSATTVDLKWRKLEQYARISDADKDEDNIGYFYILLPQNSQMGMSARNIPSATTITLYTDVSDVHYRLPCNPGVNPSYSQVEPEAFIRSKTILTNLRPKNEIRIQSATSFENYRR